MMNHDHILVCCLCLRHWQMAHLVTPSDWIMGWQLDRHVLVTVSERSGNIGGWLMISFIEWLNSTACILILANLVQMEILYGMLKGVFLIGTKFRSDMTRWSAVADSKYAILQRTNKESANVVTCRRECHLQQCPDEQTKELIAYYIMEANVNRWLARWFG